MRNNIKIADAHNDFLTFFNNENDIKNYIKNLQNSPLKTLSCAVWTSEISNPIEELKSLLGLIKGLNSDIKLLFSIEDLYFVNKNNIDEIIKLRPISCSLTWNFDNKLAGSCKANLGLTKLGRSVVKKLEKNNILIDTAHLSRKAFFELVEITSKPLYNSHTCLDSLNNNERNITDEQIDLIVKSNGFIGITFVPDFISSNNINKKVTCKDVAGLFDYIIKKFGFKNIGLGTDYCGVDQLPDKLADYNEIENLFDELRKIGYNEEVVECIAYKNFENFLKRNKLI